MVDLNKANIADGDLDGIELNYFTSLANDKLAGNSFKDGLWQTRVRVTASVQMDQRLRRQNSISPNSGSPFLHAAIYEMSDRYRFQRRQTSSQFATGSLPAFDVDDTSWFDKHLLALRQTNEDTSIAGQFTLDRFWLGEGSGVPDFLPGDAIEKITGRNFDLSAAINKAKVYPEIIQIIYLPEQQKMTLISGQKQVTTCGSFKFAFGTYDIAGNVHTGAPDEINVLVNTIVPDPPSGLKLTSYNKTTDVLVLATV